MVLPPPALTPPRSSQLCSLHCTSRSSNKVVSSNQYMSCMGQKGIEEKTKKAGSEGRVGGMNARSLVTFRETILSEGSSQVALVVRNSPANKGDIRDEGSIPGSGRSPRGGHGNPLQYSHLENPMDRGAWQATVHSVTKSQT